MIWDVGMCIGLFLVNLEKIVRMHLNVNVFSCTKPFFHFKRLHFKDNGLDGSQSGPQHNIDYILTTSNDTTIPNGLA
jgi:hypothetical protein